MNLFFHLFLMSIKEGVQFLVIALLELQVSRYLYGADYWKVEYNQFVRNSGRSVDILKAIHGHEEFLKIYRERLIISYKIYLSTFAISEIG